MNNIPDKAILKPGEWISFYDENDQESRTTRKNLESPNGKYFLNLNPNGGRYIRIQVRAKNVYANF